jgi:hypothetical protein
VPVTHGGMSREIVRPNTSIQVEGSLVDFITAYSPVAQSFLKGLLKKADLPNRNESWRSRPASRCGS